MPSCLFEQLQTGGNLNMQKLLELASLYDTDLEGFIQAASEDPEERSFTLDGQEVPVNGSN